MKKREYYETPRAGRIMRFFWKAAGGDSYILERATYSDQVKYMCLGGIVVATGLMAGLAGGYAYYTIFSPKSPEVLDKTKTLVDTAHYVPVDPQTVLFSIIFGTLWGLMIFNIDRFIVTSTGKGDGTEKITWDELKSAIPRIIMGTIIAITISKPIEIRMFKSEIDLAVQEEQIRRLDSLDQLSDKTYKFNVKEAENKVQEIQSQIDEKEKAEMEIRKEITNEITGKNNNGAAYGPRAEQLERQALVIREQIERLKSTPEYQSSLKEIEKLKKTKEIDHENAIRQAAALDGLLIRIQMAHKEAGTIISLFITLLFLSIELTPIFFKLMLNKTPYDYLAENRDDLIRAENGIEVRYDFYKDKEGMERHAIINHEADKLMFEKIKLTEIQNELTEYALEKYKEREKMNIDANLDDYIKKISPDEQNS